MKLNRLKRGKATNQSSKRRANLQGNRRVRKQKGQQGGLSLHPCYLARDNEEGGPPISSPYLARDGRDCG